jgi:hypothetical protein
MVYAVNHSIPIHNFSNNNLETLIAQLSNYESIIKSCEVKKDLGISYSYINGVKFIMENLLGLYNKVKSSFIGGAKIYALNQTVNKKVLSNFLIEIKQDLGIADKIFQGGCLDIPIAKNIIDNLSKNYNTDNKINNDAFMLGAKKVVKIIEYAYYAPLTKPFQKYITNESANIVKNISEQLNKLK